MDDHLYSETIEMLAATIAHEVKNPLALIMANVDYIQLCDKDKKFEKNTQIMKSELKKTNEMLLGFIELIKAAYRFDEDIAMYDVVMHVVENYKKRHDTGLSFQVDCAGPDKNAYFKGNQQLFAMAVSNVVKNSIESMGGKGDIHMAITQEEGKVRLSVQDNGPGLSPEALAQIAKGEKFTSKADGSGIGVDISRKIIARHEGEYAIANASTGGCLVTITVPAG